MIGIGGGTDYFVNEGNKLGFTDTCFDANTNLAAQRFIAGAALKKGRVVILTANAPIDGVQSGTTVTHATGADTDCVIGVAMFDYETGDEVSVECEGLFKLEAGGAITVPGYVKAGADGVIMQATDRASSIGIALSAAAASGDPVYVKFSL